MRTFAVANCLAGERASCAVWRAVHRLPSMCPFAPCRPTACYGGRRPKTFALPLSPADATAEDWGCQGTVWSCSDQFIVRFMALADVLGPVDLYGKADMVGRVGIEPTTKRLRVSCSTS